MTFQDKLNDVADDARNEERNQDSIKRLKSNITILDKHGISDNQIIGQVI